MAELTTDDEQQLKDEIRILNTTISNRDLEITNILNRNELEEQEAKRHKAPTLVVTDQLVEDYVLKDAEIKGILNEIDRANQIMAKLRIMATAPDTLPEYQEYIGVKQELNQKLLNRKNELRPQIRKRLEDIANIKAEPDYITEENLVISRRTLEKYRDQLKTKPVSSPDSRKAAASKSWHWAINSKASKRNSKGQNYAKKLLDEIDSLKGDLNGDAGSAPHRAARDRGRKGGWQRCQHRPSYRGPGRRRRFCWRRWESAGGSSVRAASTRPRSSPASWVCV